MEVPETPKHKLPKTVRLLFLGDVMLGRLVDKLFPTHIPDPEERELAFELLKYKNPSKIEELKRLGHKYVWSDTLPLFSEADLRLINLETSVTTHTEKWPDKAFNYQMHPANLKILQEAKIDYCSLANNHVLDFKVEGMYDTMKSLNEAGIKWAGVGKNITEARKPAVLEWNGRKIGVYSFADHYNFWAAGSNSPGINYINVEEHTPKDIDDIRNMIEGDIPKYLLDLVVVSIHWGPNYAWFPSERFRDFAHSLIGTCSVDIIHGHSSHHFQGIELYKDKPIFYGCGDFIDDYAVDPVYRNDLGFMYFVVMNFETKRAEGVQLVPTKIELFQATKTLSKSDSTWSLNAMKRLCQPFGSAVGWRQSDGFIDVTHAPWIKK